ncbi:hypothetical protein E2C01_074457 [Portunus trituberculatus]|uniref:Uncharacterized protein n=1 Tax=Portunus trituberculatus TaxID=210409 RepID=A0A5B7IC68_PORTR|nr:hypothetical protein [Portunus trituberculatus]
MYGYTGDHGAPSCVPVSYGC